MASSFPPSQVRAKGREGERERERAREGGRERERERERKRERETHTLDTLDTLGGRDSGVRAGRDSGVRACSCASVPESCTRAHTHT